ncbi:MAG: hypothetical protein J1G01_04575 [Clostridiales bacterium]|nr:hypothetical protein [Clostridiales bacterium]
MRAINEDIKILGKLTVDKLDGLFVAELFQKIDKLQTQLDEANLLIIKQQESIDLLTVCYNKAIEVINNLSVRVTALESNYDPTIIE